MYINFANVRFHRKEYFLLVNCEDLNRSQK